MNEQTAHYVDINGEVFATPPHFDSIVETFVLMNNSMIRDNVPKLERLAVLDSLMSSLRFRFLFDRL